MRSMTDNNVRNSRRKHNSMCNPKQSTPLSHPSISRYNTHTANTTVQQPIHCINLASAYGTNLRNVEFELAPNLIRLPGRLQSRTIQVGESEGLRRGHACEVVAGDGRTNTAARQQMNLRLAFRTSRAGR